MLSPIEFSKNCLGEMRMNISIYSPGNMKALPE
jgi:hypothetical protein